MYLKLVKPVFDFFSSLIGLVFILPFIIIISITLFFQYRGGNPFFLQKRVGQYGNHFTIFKLRTIDSAGNISRFSKFLRGYKIDEFLQLINILKGEMSVVGPRPDIPGYFDLLQGDERKILNLKPGLTGYASLKYFNEEKILSQENNPEHFNDYVIFPEKVKLNLWYYHHISFWLDVKIIIKTLILPFSKSNI